MENCRAKEVNSPNFNFTSTVVVKCGRALGPSSDLLAMLAKDLPFNDFSKSHYNASFCCLGR